MSKGIGLFYFGLCITSPPCEVIGEHEGCTDVRGVLKSDYTTPDWETLSIIENLPSTDILAAYRRATPSPPTPPPPLRRHRSTPRCATMVRCQFACPSVSGTSS